MAGSDSVEFDYVPNFTAPTHQYGTPVNSATAYADQFLAEAVQELLASTVAYRQRGVTLAAGQGVLPSGCVLAQNTATGYYYAHTASGANGPGTNVAIGILRDSRDTGGASSPSGKPATNALGNMVYSGALNASMISGTDTTALVSGFGGGIGSSTNGAWTTLLSAGRLSKSPTLTGQAFPGSPFDSSEGNIFIF